MIMTMQNHANLEDLEIKDDNNSNMLLVSEGSADIQSAKYDSANKPPELKSKI